MNQSNQYSFPSLSSFGGTRVGRIRQTNQDQYLIASLGKQITVSQSSVPQDDWNSFTAPQAQLFVVADGMGGHPAGERASSLAIQSLVEYVLQMMHWHLCEAKTRENAMPAEFIRALGFCQENLRCYAEQHPECRGMGTTLTAAYLSWPHLFVLHAGDSRCYLLRDRGILQVTVDHTVTQRMVDAGTLSPEAAVDSSWAHCLWNAIGGNTDAVQPQLAHIELRPGDSLLLCSDGLTNHVSNDQLLAILKSDLNSREACERLIQEALEEGGRDNITVVISRVEPSKIPSDHHSTQSTMPQPKTDEFAPFSTRFDTTPSESAAEIQETLAVA